MTSMTAAQIAATRALLGLSQTDFSRALGVTRVAVAGWEAGKFRAVPGVVADIQALRDEHDQLVKDLESSPRPVVIPREGTRPRSWYLAAAARLIDRQPDTVIEWEPEEDYFVLKAREVIARAQGDPDTAGPLAEWARHAKEHGDDRDGVLVAESGRLIAHTRHRLATNATPGETRVVEALTEDAGPLVGEHLDSAVAKARRVVGEQVIHVKRSQVCSGAREFIKRV